MITLLAALFFAGDVKPKPCTAATATKTTVEAIGADANGMTGHCVTVSGPVSSIAMFSGVPGIYQTARQGLNGNPDRTVTRRHRIGLYSKGNAIRGLKPTGASGLPHLTVTGIVDTCEAKSERIEAAAGPYDVVMMGGYCHYHGGAVIDAVHFTVDPVRRYARLTGERARKLHGNVVEAPADWPHLAKLRTLGNQFRSALRLGDRNRLATLHDFKDSLDEHENNGMQLLMNWTNSPFAEVRNDAALPMAIFVDRLDVERRATGTAPPFLDGTICFCRTHNCAGSWPIARNDADNHTDRPYACTRIEDQDWPGGKPFLTTPVGSGVWLAEPRRTAFRARVKSPTASRR